MLKILAGESWTSIVHNIYGTDLRTEDLFSQGVFENWFYLLLETYEGAAALVLYFSAAGGLVVRSSTCNQKLWVCPKLCTYASALDFRV